MRKRNPDFVGSQRKVYHPLVDDLHSYGLKKEDCSAMLIVRNGK